MSKFEVIELGKYVHTKFRDGNPFALYFVYTPSGNYLIKGQNNTVRSYIDEHFPKCIHHYTIWHKGQSRGMWLADKNRCLYIRKVYEKHLPNYGKWEVMMFVLGSLEPKRYYFKRMPHKWLSIFDEAAEKRQFSAYANAEGKRQLDIQRNPLKTGNTNLPTGVKKDRNGLRML